MDFTIPYTSTLKFLVLQGICHLLLLTPSGFQCVMVFRKTQSLWHSKDESMTITLFIFG